MGHALIVDKEIRDFPSDLHPDMGFVSLVNTYNLWDQEILYLDLSPFVNLSLCLPITAAAVAAIHNAHLLKSRFLADYNGRVVGLRGLVLVEGKEWKDMRTTFNSGFSAVNTIARVPDMVDEADIFVDILEGIAKKDGFVESFETLAKRLTFDIIMLAVLGIKSSSQTKEHPLGKLIRIIAGLPGDATSINPLHQINIIKFGKMRYYEWKIKQWLRPVILERWKKIENPSEGAREKVILDLALEKERDGKTAMIARSGGLSEDYIDQLSDM
jgi:cytochrome P450